jgi:hypothetical protein
VYYEEWKCRLNVVGALSQIGITQILLLRTKIMEVLIILGILVASLWAHFSIKRDETEVEAGKKRRQKQRLLDAEKEANVEKPHTPLTCWNCKKVTTNSDECEHCGADSKVNGYFGYTTSKVCPRCSGRGYIPKYSHVESGRCFLCNR